MLGDGVTTGNDDALLASNLVTTFLIAREGDPAPGMDGVFDGHIFLVAVSPDGAVLFRTSVLQSDASRATTIWTWKEGNLNLIARPGQDAPGFPERTFSSVGDPTLSRNGRVAFLARLSDDRLSIWLTDEDGNNPEYVIGKDDWMPIAKGGFKKIRSLSLPNPEHGYAFDSNGRVLVSLTPVSASSAYALVEPGFTWQGIAGTVFEDTDEDGGNSDPDRGLSGALVRLYANNGQGMPAGEILQEASTDRSGNYQFDNLAAGDYVVELTVPVGYRLVTDSAEPGDDRVIPVSVDEDSFSPEHTFLIGLQPVSIAGSVFNDDDQSQTFTDLDLGVSEMLVRVFSDNGEGVPEGEAIQEVTTDIDGSYAFRGLEPGNYVVTIDLPDRFEFIRDVVSPVGDRYIPVALVDDRVVEQDFLVFALGPPPTSISGKFLDDLDGDGDPADEDPPATGRFVRLYLDDGNGSLPGDYLFEVEVDASGRYHFPNLEAGDYILTLVENDRPFPFRLPGTLDLPFQYSFSIETGQELTQNFLTLSLTELVVSVLEDTDDDGEGDRPVPGVVIEIKDEGPHLGHTAPLCIHHRYGWQNFPSGVSRTFHHYQDRSFLFRSCKRPGRSERQPDLDQRSFG